MKRPFEFICAIFLLAGLLIGGILPMPWDQKPATVASGTITFGSSADPDTPQKNPASPGTPPLDSRDNFVLLNTACYVVRALQQQDYAAVSSVIHPQRGVTFTPYSTVDFETDLSFSRQQVRDMAQDSTVYTWGLTDGRGSPISMTMTEYFDSFVFNADYTQADLIGVDQILISGNALDNLPEAYPGCRFVDFSIPESSEGLDWNSLRLVFEPGETCWYLVGIVHGQWTI